MALASMLKLRASPRITPFGAVFTIAVAVLSALVFTRPVMQWLNISQEPYNIAAVAALIALSGEHIARQLMELKIVDLLRAWRGK